MNQCILYHLLRVIPLLLILPIPTFATVPPQNTIFPAGFWSKNTEPEFRGDPGWVTRMKNRREALKALPRGKFTDTVLDRDRFVMPVLLGQFSNVESVHTREEVRELLFGENPDGSLTDYYEEVSHGRFHITGDVYGWFTSDQTQKYYASDNYGKGQAPRNRSGFAMELIMLADPEVDFGMYDNDGPDGVPNSGDDDGVVDTVICVSSGHDPSGNQSVMNLWPGAGYLDRLITTNDPAARGGHIMVLHYIVCVELRGSDDRLAGIGVYAHEFGHILGLPDLYDRTDESQEPDHNKSEGVGRWCLMAGGSWGGDGVHQESPSHLSAWCKAQLGWVAPVCISERVTGLSIPAAETTPTVYQLWEDGYHGSRFFLLENRQRIGFDRYLHGTGLMIYHVDEYRSCGKLAWMWGTCNDDETHKLVDVEEADGRNDLDGPDKNRGDEGDPFPGSTGNRTFADYTVPNSRDYDGNYTGVAVYNISAPGEVMTADVRPRKKLGYMIAYDENGMSGWGWGMAEPTDFWGGVLFTAKEAGRLTGVDFGATNHDTRFEVTIYESLRDLMPEGALTEVSGYAPVAGWYTVCLPDSGIMFNPGDDFFIQVKVIGKRYSIPFERGSARSGRSYVSGDGNRFTDAISTNSVGGDINLRARIQTAEEEVSIAELQPLEFRVFPPYPNPFNPSTTIRYELPVRSRVYLAIHDVLGRSIRVLVNGIRPAGLNSEIWNGTDRSGRRVGSGTYFYRFTAGSHTGTGKLMLVK